MQDHQATIDPCDENLPLVTILLCTDRDDPLLARAIDSCLVQTYRHFELLVVANGSASKELFHSLSKRYQAVPKVRVVHTLTRDLNFSLDLGIHFALGEYLARMDSDDIMTPDRIEVQLKFMSAHPDVVVAGSFYELVDLDLNVRERVQLPTSNEQIRKRLFFRNSFCHPTVMFRTDRIRRAGGYRGGKNSEDYDLWTRLCLDPSVKFHNIPQYLLKYNSDPSGAARRSRSAYANVVAAQVRSFLLTWDIRWLFGALTTASKLVFRTNKH
jgi:glycosyltransferase involved in cell wall biosynthesis